MQCRATVICWGIRICQMTSNCVSHLILQQVYSATLQKIRALGMVKFGIEQSSRNKNLFYWRLSFFSSIEHSRTMVKFDLLLLLIEQYAPRQLVRSTFEFRCFI